MDPAWHLACPSFARCAGLRRAEYSPRCLWRQDPFAPAPVTCGLSWPSFRGTSQSQNMSRLSRFVQSRESGYCGEMHSLCRFEVCPQRRGSAGLPVPSAIHVAEKGWGAFGELPAGEATPLLEEPQLVCSVSSRLLCAESSSQLIGQPSSLAATSGSASPACTYAITCATVYG